MKNWKHRMKSPVLTVALGVGMALSNSALANGADPMQASNVVWDSPSKDSSGSMPIGNGDLGANVWVEENGDLLLLLGKTDAWSDVGRLLKLGLVRVRLNPSLVKGGTPFRQELQLRQGQIEIRGGADGSQTVLRVWVDANRPVIHVEGESQQPFQTEVGLILWRTKDRDLNGDWTALGVCRGGVSIIETADVVLPPDNSTIRWYHRNARSVYPLTMKVQGLESLIDKVPDPLLNRTFGGCIGGEGLVHTEAPGMAQALKSAEPSRRLDLRIHVLTAQTATVPQWREQLASLVKADAKTSLRKARAEHGKWWDQFWNRSWIRVTTPEDAVAATPQQQEARRTVRRDVEEHGRDNQVVSDEPAGLVLTRGYALQRFIQACSGRGAYPIKFNGSIFTVNTHDPKDLNQMDHRNWGPNYWFQNTRLIYWAMLRNGDYEMMRPWFAMYRNILPLAQARTPLYYKHEGVFFPETMYPWGVYPPDEYSSAGNWDRGDRPIPLLENKYIRYLWQGGLELTAAMLDYHSGTGDAGFLRDTLLPIANGVVTFYDQHYKRDEKGKIRFEPACSLEMWHTAVNPLPEIAGLRYLLPQLLALPADLTSDSQRRVWQRVLNDLPKVPMTGGDKPRLQPAEQFSDPVTGYNVENPELYAIFPYRLYALGQPGLETGRESFANCAFKSTGGWRQTPIQAAYLGLTDRAALLTVANFATHHAASRFPAFWGPNDDWIPDQCHGSVAMLALQSMLLQCDGRKIVLLPAWPKDWQADFKLHAAYQTTVQGKVRGGKLVDLVVTPPERKSDVALPGM